MVTEIKKFEPLKSEEKELKHTGFGSLTTGYEDIGLSLDRYLIDHPSSTYFMIAKGNTGLEHSINSEDILIIDKSIDPKNGSIVVVCVKGEFTLKKLTRENGETLLYSLDNSKQIATKIEKDEDFSIEGTVTYVIHKLK